MASIVQTRSRTDPPAPEQSAGERTHVPRRLHANTLRTKGMHGSSSHSHHQYRQNAKDTVQSAIELKPPISFDHILRRDKKTSESRRSVEFSRQGSGSAQPQQRVDGTGSGPLAAPQRTIRPEDVAKAKKENVKREEELRESLKSVEEGGMNSTRQLDDTYYAILEKASVLRSTVASIQQLADESLRMQTCFKEDTSKLERETKQNLNSFGNFDGQEKMINSLVSQLQDSRSKTNALNDRLENARLRVEAYEERKNAKQAKRRRRWYITWGTLVGVLVLIVAVLLAKNRRAVGHQLVRVERGLAKIGDVVEEVASPLSARLRSSPSEDAYLRKLFDEL